MKPTIIAINTIKAYFTLNLTETKILRDIQHACVCVHCVCVRD